MLTQVTAPMYSTAYRSYGKQVITMRKLGDLDLDWLVRLLARVDDAELEEDLGVLESDGLTLVGLALAPDDHVQLTLACEPARAHLHSHSHSHSPALGT